MGMSKDRQQQVVLNYKSNGGNMKKAMIDAGYSETYADRNSKYLLGIIGEQIREEQNAIKSEKIKSVADIQEWWSGMIDNPEAETKDKIKCSELLVKSMGGFTDNVKIDGNINNPFEGLTTEQLEKLAGDCD
jgi:hypothetical protein